MTSALKFLQHALPKPLLFGLYGAFGSLAGALLLGEVLWMLLVPPPPPPPSPPPPALRVAVSEAMSVNQGDANQFIVRIARDNFTGDVSVKCDGMLRGISAGEVVIPGGKDEVEVEIAAARDAEVGAHPVKVIATGASAMGNASIGVTVVKVDPSPPVLVDIVFVLDVTGSMGFALNGIIQGIGDFARELDSRELDVRLGLLAFEDTLIGESSRVLKFGEGNPFAKDYEAFRRELRTVELGGGGDEPESSLDGLAEAARLPFRQEAAKVLLLVTDASPHIPDKAVRSLEDCRGVLKQAGISQLHLVVRPEHQNIYTPLQAGITGEYFDLVTAAGGSAGFAKILPSVSSAIAKITIQNRPSGPTAMALGKPAPPAALPSIKGVQSSQEFSADSRWQLLLAIAVWTAISAIGITVMLLAGQHFYLRQSLLPLTAAVNGMALGCFAGLAGGAAGQVLYGILSPTAFLDGAFRAVGWSLLGATVAYGISLSVPNLRWDKALMGGALGGTAGAIGFLSATFFLPSNAVGDIGGRLVGATLVGFFIGLMVAWAESAFRSAWLEIRYGAREIRRVNLGPEPVSLGSDSKLCTIYVSGGAPIALRYRVNQARVIRETVPTGQVEEVRDGSRQSLGNIEVTVRTSADSSKLSPPAPTVVLPPPPKSTGSTTVPPTVAAASLSTASAPSLAVSSNAPVSGTPAMHHRPPFATLPSSPPRSSTPAPASPSPTTSAAKSSSPKEPSPSTGKLPLPPPPPRKS